MIRMIAASPPPQVRLKDALEESRNASRGPQDAEARAEGWLEWAFGICEPDGRVGKKGSRCAHRPWPPREADSRVEGRPTAPASGGGEGGGGGGGARRAAGVPLRPGSGARWPHGRAPPHCPGLWATARARLRLGGRARPQPRRGAELP